MRRLLARRMPEQWPADRLLFMAAVRLSRCGPFSPRLLERWDELLAGHAIWRSLALRIHRAGWARFDAQQESPKDDVQKRRDAGEAVPEVCAIVPDAPAERPGAATKAAVDRSSILRLVLQANPMLWPLAICSVVTLGYVLERLLALRRDRVVPREFADRFLERLSSGKLDRERALELCRAHDSPAARVFAMVVGAWGQSGVAIRQMVSHDAAGEVVELKRNLRILERDGDAGAAPGFAGDGGRHHPVIRRPGRPDRACPRRDACPRDQPGAGRDGIRAGDRDRRGHVLLFFSQSRRCAASASWTIARAR